MARDSAAARGARKIALIGPLAAANATPRLVTVLDPDSGASYTLDDERRVAYRNIRAGGKKLIELEKLETKLNAAGAGEQANVQDLGVRTIEGVRARGTRTTTTIAAGAIGNFSPSTSSPSAGSRPSCRCPCSSRATIRAMATRRTA